MTARAALYALLLGAASAGCAARYVPSQIAFDLDPVSELDVAHGNRGRWLGVMRGAGATDLEELPNGDVLLAGDAQSSFVTRLSPDGETLFTFVLFGCGGVHTAAGSDDEIYVAMHGLLSLGEASEERVRDKNRLCAPLISAQTTILRLNRSGHVLWKTKVPGTRRGTPQLFAVPGRLVVIGQMGDGPTPTFLGLSPKGHLAWTKNVRGTLSVTQAWPTRGALVGLDDGFGSPCTVRAFDAMTGDATWERPLDVESSDEDHPCNRGWLSISPAGALLATGETLYGLAPDTWARTFERRNDASNRWSPRFVGRVSQELVPFVRNHFRRKGHGRDPVVLGVDPRSGQAIPLARFEENVPNVVVEAANVTAVSWGARALLVAGSFFGGMTLFDMERETKPLPTSVCAGGDKTLCRPGNLYRTSLFVARLPLSSFDGVTSRK